MRKSSLALVLAAAVGMTAATAHAETREEWIALGTRVHGGIGAFIPVGIRIGLDALERLKAGPREVTVLYLVSSPGAQCERRSATLSSSTPARSALSLCIGCD